MANLAPKDSPAHRLLREHVTEAGLSGEAVGDLLWRMNAHVDLIAFAQIGSNLQQILELIRSCWNTKLEH